MQQIFLRHYGGMIVREGAGAYHLVYSINLFLLQTFVTVTLKKLISVVE